MYGQSVPLDIVKATVVDAHEGNSESDVKLQKLSGVLEIGAG